jgi:hypothetical protein
MVDVNGRRRHAARRSRPARPSEAALASVDRPGAARTAYYLPVPTVDTLSLTSHGIVDVRPASPTCSTAQYTPFHYGGQALVHARGPWCALFVNMALFPRSYQPSGHSEHLARARDVHQVDDVVRLVEARRSTCSPSASRLTSCSSRMVRRSSATRLKRLASVERGVSQASALVVPSRVKRPTILSFSGQICGGTCSSHSHPGKISAKPRGLEGVPPPDLWGQGPAEDSRCV